MRLFIAVELSDAVRRGAADASREISSLAPGRYSHPENLHVTVRFLGECPPGGVPDILGAMERAAAHTAPFTLGLGPAGYFERGREAVVWLDLRGDRRTLIGLHDRLEMELAAAGFPEEGRRYAPHLTLARRVPVSALGSLSQIPVEDAVMTVEHLTLMESTRVQGRLSYLSRGRVELTGIEKAVVDRIEGAWAVCRTLDGNRERLVHISRLPTDIREGDVLVVSGRDIRIDSGETQKRRKAGEKWLNRWK